MAPLPDNIGIKAMEIYVPSQYVNQSELEKFDGVSAGKYTIGLGQAKMSFCDDREDIYSLALTVTSNLLKKYHIDTNSIGRLEVGTETILDKSKSVKSVLMQLFGDNTSIEGVDNVNACYGGTSALLNSVNWVESSAWDGRDAIVVAADIAIYAEGSARPAGGAGAVAMLIGPDAPIVLEPGLRGTYMQHAYDFYKPDLTTEYPYVDGHYSVKCYTRALDAAYRAYGKCEAKLLGNDNADVGDANKSSLDRFDYMVFHAPTSNPAKTVFADVPPECSDLDYETSFTDKLVERTFINLTGQMFRDRVSPAIELAKMCGNMYCASVWGGLASLISFTKPNALMGKRIGVFSYGSGLASSFVSFRVHRGVDVITKTLDMPARLDDRYAISPYGYDQACELRYQAHLKKDYTPKGSVATIKAGTYYLAKVDAMFKREYFVKN